MELFKKRQVQKKKKKIKIVDITSYLSPMPWEEQK